MSVKKILITGTSTGVGKALAVTLAKGGHKVWATMRNLAKKGPLEEEASAAGVSITIKELDVEQTESVDRCIADMINAEGGIDVLVNNAGAGFVRTIEQATEEELKWVMDINFMGTVRCTKAVIPHMRVARSGHIINVSSVGGLVGQPFNEMYCASKFAVEGMTEAMASYMTPAFGIRFTSVEPGGISTEFVNNVMANISASGGMKDDEYAPLLQMYMGARQTREAPEEGSVDQVYQTAQSVADVIVQKVIASADPPVRIRTSAWAEHFCRLKTSADPEGRIVQDEVARTVLGAKSGSELK